MEGKNYAWAEDDVVRAVGIFGLCLDDSDASNVKERRRRIPFDFQRTSFAGLVLDSATSSGLGRAPCSAMQDPIQAPPGTTRQVELCTSW
ncbi:hypothetical protein TNCV_3542151 [Trichonephila clavipes]|nr:hypothetical protein TNCV_3542151 [Trichonephila clavipes]